MPARVQLTLTSGKFAGFTYTFDERSTWIVGKEEKCRLRFPKDADHATISRHHCLFDVNPPFIRVRDLGSRNGTFVNGAKIGQRRSVRPEQTAAGATQALEIDLKNGDEVSLGRLGLAVLRVAVETPLTCARCGAEVMPQATEKAGEPGARVLCPACALHATKAETGGWQTCCCCGADVRGETAGQGGQFICSVCRSKPTGIMRRMLDHAREGEAALTAIKDYDCVRELGRGGMGAVFLARHRVTGEELALKVMLPQVALSARVKQMFLREIENTRLLHHTNVVRLRDLGDSEGAFFFAMDFCPAGSVQHLVENRGALPPHEALAIALQALDGLQYAHTLDVPVALADGNVGRATGLVHRDLKPANLFLGRPSAPWDVKVGDYGLAKAFDAAGLSGLTWTGAACGTPHYMPRAQVINFRFARPEVDVWACAACLYFMLCGRPPRDFKPGIDVWRAILETKPVPLAQRKPDIPPRLAAVVDHALREEPEIPFKSATELRHALQSSGIKPE